MTHPRRRGWLASTALLILLAPLTLHPLHAEHLRRSQAQPTHLYIMFLPGLCGPYKPDCQSRTDAAARARATFRLVEGALTTARVSYKALYYGYNPNTPRTYSIDDTRQPISRSVEALDRQLRAVRQRDAGARFDLVGYSLGGVVATSWAVTTGRSPSGKGLARFVHSIVTFDSPVKGIHIGIAAPVVQQFFGSSVWKDLLPSSATIRGIIAFGNPWWRTAGHLHTAANIADRIVPPSAALLGETRTVTDRHCTLDVLVFSFCHGAIMQDSQLSLYVACHWITTTTQCIATPTPTLVPPTATPTPLPTATATATPTATATLTLTVAPPPPPRRGP